MDGEKVRLLSVGSKTLVSNGTNIREKLKKMGTYCQYLSRFSLRSSSTPLPGLWLLQPVFDPAALGLKEINNLANFGVSSHKPGNGESGW